MSEMVVRTIEIKPYDQSLVTEPTIQESNIDGSAPQPISDGDRQEKTSEKKPTPRTYLKRIPIAGLHNLLYAEEKWEVYLWLVTLFLAFVVTVRCIVPAFTQYLEFDTGLEIRHVSDPDVPFPTVQVCMTDGVNETRIHHLVDEIEPRLIQDARYRRLAERYRLLVDWMNDCTGPSCRGPPLIYLAVLHMIHAPMWKIDWLDRKHLVALNEAISEIIDAFGTDWPGWSELYKDMYKCQDVLMRCGYNGIEFPCCHQGSYGLMAARSVYFKLSVCTFLSVPTVHSG